MRVKWFFYWCIFQQLFGQTQILLDFNVIERTNKNPASRGYICLEAKDSFSFLNLTLLFFLPNFAQHKINSIETRF